MKSFKTIALCLAFSLIGSVASAQIEKPQAAGYAGLLLGYSDPTNADGRLAYGADVGMIFPRGLTGSLFFYNSVGKEQNADVQIMHYGLGLGYSLSGMFDGWLGGLNAGVKVGMSSVDVDTPGAKDGDAEFAFGPSLGMDYMITSSFSLGGQADLLFVTAEPGYSNLFLFATGKFWF